MSISSEQLDSLILKIYEAALCPNLWDEITLELSDLTNSGATQLLVVDKNTGSENIDAGARLDVDAQRQYVEYYYSLDLRVPKILTHKVGDIIIEQKLLNEEEKKKNAQVSQFLQQHQLENLTGTNLSIDNKFIWLGLSRKGDNNYFDKEELALFSRLIPHLRKSLRLQHILQDVNHKADSLSQLWDYNGKGVLLLSSDGQIRFANQFIEQLFKTDIIMFQKNTLIFKDRIAHKRYRHMMKRALSDQDLTAPAQDSFLISDQLGNDYGIRLFRHATGSPLFEDIMRISIIVLISPLNTHRIYQGEEIDKFGELYGLTPAEKSVLNALSKLTDLSDFAAETQRQPNTVRKQLKSVMSKVGVNSQKGLIRLLDRFCFIQTR